MSQALYQIPLRRIDGSDTTLQAFAGKVLLIVNVASRCGLTPQYAGLEQLHERFSEQGFAVLGFPANDFAGQEPGSDEEIQGFCTTTYGVQFPMFSKIPVTGADKHPLYAHLIQARPETEARDSMATRLQGYGIAPNPVPEVLWNFEKFLVNREGKVVGRFSPDMSPDADALVAAVENALADRS